MSLRFCLVCLSLLLSSAPVIAQVDTAIETVKSHLIQDASRFGTTAADLGGLVATAAYTSRRSGATYVYLRQSVGGIEIVNSHAHAAVKPDGEIFASRPQFFTNLAARVTATDPSLSATAGESAAVRHLVRTIERPVGPVSASDRIGEVVQEVGAPYALTDFVPAPDRTKLVFFPTTDGPIHLAWQVEVEARFGHLWLVFVDARSGSLLDTISLTDSDDWGSLRSSGPRVADFAPLATRTSAMASALSGTYNVFALPAESPSHGPQINVVNPHDPTASQLGWHNTGASSFTITRGNNVYAYEDRDGNNLPGFSPDGGGGLVFDFPFDDTQQPVDYQELAITNLFYWNNITHDVMYQYGFDEPAGNFQTNNFGNGGNGNDHVLAEAQDGSGTDNANFSTPSDGGSGRMQMFEWSPGSTFRIDAPPAIAGTYPHGTQVPDTAGGAPDWGDTDGFSISADLVLAESVEGDALACLPVVNGEMNGNIAVIERGGCTFLLKVFNAQQAGAIGAVIHNCDPAQPDCTGANPGEVILNMIADPTDPNFPLTVIPAMFVTLSTGTAIRANLPGASATMEETTLFRDSDLDAGVIVHEYAHGISNRLTGGPVVVTCLNNQEQMGEGWSDYYGMMLTQQPGDTATQPRGVATYLEGEPIDGIGIRPAPYSTDMAINPFTYDDTRTGGLSVPHGIGFVWATALWEMTWDLIAAHGYDPDIYNATGTAGNQIALQLVTEGLKLQPCSPGFVDGRDAILEADTLLYGGAYSSILWPAFARRGLGLLADQGSSASNADNFGDDSFPVANEAGLNVPESYTLSQAYPNPFNPQAQFTLAVGQSQNVRVEVFDILGRQVLLLHDGQLAGGILHRFNINGADLASGVYTYRARGEHFNASRRITLMK